MSNEEPTIPTPKRGIRKGIYIIPSAFTIGNILCGFYAIINSIKGAQYLNSPEQAAVLYDHAAKAIGIAWLLDGLDGRIARMTNATSDFGVELDSIADVLSFGVAPAVMLYTWGYGAVPGLEKLGWGASFFFLICGALRLARFNVMARAPRFSQSGTSPKLDKRYFVGLPIPAAAGGIAALIHFTPYPLLGRLPVDATFYGYALLSLAFLLSLLMVSGFKYASFKQVGLKTNKPFIILPLISLLVAGVWFYSRWILLIGAVVYVGHGVVGKLWSLTGRFRRSPNSDTPVPSSKLI